MKIKISADSTCDLPQELVKEFDIGICPLHITVDGRDYRDGVDMAPAQLYEEIKRCGKLGTTSAVSVQEYIDYWNEWKAGCDAIVHIGFASDMSATLQNARIAAAEMDVPVYIADSQNLSSGYGHLVLDAAELAREGMEPQAIIEEIERRVPLVDASFLVDTLDFLAKGGRCSAVAALGANLLSLKPCVEVREGKMAVGKKYRGTIEKALLKYVRERLADRGDIDPRRIFITNSGGFSQEALDAIEREVLSCRQFETVYRAEAGCTIANHCGPGTLGILYYRK